MNDKDKNLPNQLNIELPDDVAEGVYSNLIIVSHSANEFVVDFVRIVPNKTQHKVKSRVILNPQTAKRLLLTLNDGIRRYEAQFGTIKDPDMNPPFPTSFHTGQA